MLNVDVDGPNSETLLNLSSLSLDLLFSLREELFKQTLSQSLVCDGDVLVSRRDSKRKPLGTKLAEDIVSLIGCIKNGVDVPRTLLRNGKRSRKYFDSQKDVDASMTPSQCPSSSSATSIDCPDSSAALLQPPPVHHNISPPLTTASGLQPIAL